MKFKIKHEKSNLVFMSSILVLCLITCSLFLIIKEYMYMFIYLILTIVISYFYFFTYYYLKKDYLIIKIGFIKVKIDYKKILKIENNNKFIGLKLKYFKINIYPSNKDKFLEELNKKKG